MGLALFPSVEKHTGETAKQLNTCDGLHMLGPGSGTIMSEMEWVWPCWSGCGLVGVGVALWSGCDLVGVGLSLWAWALISSF